MQAVETLKIVSLAGCSLKGRILQLNGANITENRAESLMQGLWLNKLITVLSDDHNMVNNRPVNLKLLKADAVRLEMKKIHRGN